MTQDNNRKRLIALLTALDISLASVAKLVGKSRPWVSRIVSGDIEADHLYKMLEDRLAPQGRHARRA